MLAVGSHNGLAAVARTREAMLAGSTPLDAVVAGVTLVEDDPAELTVGYGGLPNEEGIVELDAAVMDGRTGRGGAVAGLRGVRNPAKVARLVMQQTKRVLLVGEGALKFALANGFREEDLLTERAREIWLYWKRTRSSVDDWKAPEGPLTPVAEWIEKYFYGKLGPEGADLKGGTVHVAARSDGGDLACCTSTSGHAFKIPGRVGDSPILGAGLYADNAAGTCGSIGHGEANLENLSSFLAVELMRQGRSPVEAGLEVLRRVADRTRDEDRNEQGRPRFNLQLFLIGADGSHAGVAMSGPKPYAVADESGARLEECEFLFERESVS
jgi:N4-(beta-N-acetylglucosaminyl)-L-asparaginase